jgi:hypothetical protein
MINMPAIPKTIIANEGIHPVIPKKRSSSAVDITKMRKVCLMVFLCFNGFRGVFPLESNAS